MILSIEQFEKQIKQGEINSLYLLYGEDAFLLEASLKKIKNQFGELKVGINYITIDDTNVNTLISNIETPAFGYNRKLIIIKDCVLFKKESKRKGQNNLEISNKISKYINENIDIINQSVILVFIEQETEKNELFKTVESNGIICNFEELKPNQIALRIKSICNAYKVNIEDSTLKYFIETCGTNMQDLINEIRKLIEYRGENQTIVSQDIDLLCIKKLDSIIFDLTDNLGKKNVSKALDILNELIYNKEPIQIILITLYNHFKKLYIIKLAERENRNIAEALKLKPNQTFLVAKYKTQSKYFKEEELNKIIQELIDLDYNYKTGRIDINIGLESILCTL